jgi:hypothetical protein
MCYDSVRQVVVMYGGRAGSADLQDTWEWSANTNQWSLRSITGPGPESEAIMEFDASIGKTILIVGGNQDSMETWAWDGITWERWAIPSMSWRGDAAMVFDPSRNGLLVYGGKVSGYVANDPAVHTQPVEQLTVLEGQPLELEVRAVGNTPVSYQWRHEGVDLFDGPTVSGSQSPVLMIAGAMPTDAGEYDAVITNACSTITSRAATVEVHRLGDVDHNGVVNVGDLLAVIGAWGACPPPCAADVAPPPSGNGLVNVADLLLVIQNWG